MANNNTITVGVDRNWNVNFGQLCDGDTVVLRLCNYDGGSHTGTIRVCGCEAFTFSTTSFTLNACECTNITLTFNGNGYPANGSCFIEVDFNNRKSSINLSWQEVYCALGVRSWSLSDSNNLIPINESNFNADCDIFTSGAMGEAKIITRSLTVTQPLVAGDVLYLSQWLFAQVPEWNLNTYPIAGWKYRVCLISEGREEPSVDGTFNMEWYGEQPSEEISQTTPFVQCTIANNGTTVDYTIQFNLPQDTVRKPENNAYDNHRQLLANTVQNGLELNNSADNSIYRNYKYMSWAFVLYRSVGNVYQDDLFSIKGTLPFYAESVTGNACVFGTPVLTLTTPTGQPTQYLSTVRSTKFRVDFQFFSSSIVGTPPDDMWVYLIRNDSKNNQLDLYENYEYEQADLTNGVGSTNIFPVTPPTNISGNDFYAEFGIAPLHTNLTGVEDISNNYRLIFVVHSTIDMACRTNVSEPIQLINYDDEHMTIPGGSVVWRTIEQEYLPTQNVLTDIAVNMNLDTVLRVNLPLSDAEVQAKSGGLIQTASEAFKGAELRIYEQSPLTGTTLLNVEYFNAESQRICDGNTDTGGVVNRSVGNNIELVYPFTIPDNVYRKIGREALYQSDASQPNDWSTLSLASLSCVQNRQSEQCDVLYALPSISPVLNPNYMVYVPDTNEVWVAGEDANPGDGAIYAIDLSNNLSVSQIVTIGSDVPSGMLYVPGVGVLASFPSGSIRFYIPTSRATITTLPVGLGSIGMIYLAQYNEVWVACNVSSEVYRINPATQTVIGSPLSVPASGCIDLAYVNTLDEVWVACQSSNDVQRIDRSTFTLTGAPIATSSTNPKQILYSQVGNVWVSSDDDIDVIDITTFAVIQTINNPSQLGYGLLENAGIIYASDAGANLIRLYDSTLFTALSTYATGTSPRNILFAPNVLLVGNKTTDDVTPYQLDCNDSLPPFTMANREILLDWTLQFDFFDNTEYYTYKQKLSRPSPSRVADFINDFVDIIIEEYQEDGNTQIINNICPTTNTVNIQANLQSPKLPFSVGVELQPIRGGVFSSETPASPITIPADSPYITNLTPATFGSTSTISFDLNVPALPIVGDYEINLHFLLK
jgi:hypothetical protein